MFDPIEAKTYPSETLKRRARRLRDCVFKQGWGLEDLGRHYGAKVKRVVLMVGEKEAVPRGLVWSQELADTLERETYCSLHELRSIILWALINDRAKQSDEEATYIKGLLIRIEANMQVLDAVQRFPQLSFTFCDVWNSGPFGAYKWLVDTMQRLEAAERNTLSDEEFEDVMQQTAAAARLVADRCLRP